jgi:hypothetical protein
VLLLLSIDFINSSYCYDIELDKALEQNDGKKCIVIPVILRACMWQHTPFAKLQALPKDAKPVCAWLDRDEAFVNVVNQSSSRKAAGLTADERSEGRRFQAATLRTFSSY